MKRNRYMIVTLLLCLLTGCKAQAQPAARMAEETQAVTETAAETAAPEIAAEEQEPETTAPTVHREPPEDAVIIVDATIEVHEKMTVSGLLAGTNVQLLNDDEVVDTSTTGECSTSISYTYEGELYEHEISYTVKDTTAPLLLNGGYDAEVELGDAFDLNEHVGYADNYDRSPQLTYWGTVDTSVCGTYPLLATVTDSSGNATSWELSIRVVEQKSEPADNQPRLTFDALREQYAGEHVSFGIDVSKWQKNIDFEEVRNAGCEFVIMRMGYFYDEIIMDEYYLSNMERARAAGLDVGVYIYTTANTEEEVRENARWIIQQLDGQELDFPVVFDWESFSNFQQYGMSIHDLNVLFNVFAEELEQHGYSAMLYSSRNYLNDFWYETEHPVWLAHYTDRTNYAGDYVMWQMSSRGRIHGITGDVDLNILYKDRAEAMQKGKSER